MGARLADRFSAWRSADGKLRVSSVETQHDLMTGDDVSTLEGTELPLPSDPDGLPKFLRISGLGDFAYVAWPSGRLLRYEIRNLAHPRLVEDLNALGEPSARLTPVYFEAAAGAGSSLVIGDSSGRVRIWFPVAPNENQASAAPDGRKMIHAQEFSIDNSAVTSLCSAAAAREFAVGCASGRTELIHVTSLKTILDQKTVDHQPIEAVAISPKAICFWPPRTSR